MSTSFELAASIREDLGKSATRRLRKQEMVPAVVYGAGVEPVSVTLSHNQLLHSTENEAFFSHILSLNVDGKVEKVIIKALQRHPSRAILMHADFLRVNMKEKLKVNVPIHWVGEDVSPGVKEGGVVTHDMVDIEIECLPKDLPEYIEVDISGMDIGSTMHLSDIKLPKGLAVVALAQGDDHDLQVVAIQANRAVVESDSADDESAEVEGEEAKQDS